MATNACPECGRPIATADINIAEGVALCRACGKLSKLSELVEEVVVDASAITRPPAGCTYDASPSGPTVIRASARSAGGAIGLLAICLFWNGIVSVFLLQVIAGFYTHFVGPLPQWFPAPSNHGKSDIMSLGTSLFMCVFLTPFVVVGLGMLGGFLLSVAGRVEVLVNGFDGRVRTGVGPFSWTRRFDASQVQHVNLGLTKWKENGQSKERIEIVAADRTVRFGTILTPERRQWMRTVLHIRLVRGDRSSKLASTSSFRR